MTNVNKRPNLWAYIVQRTKSNWFIFAIMASYVIFSIASSVYFGVTGDTRDCWVSLVYMLIVPVFYLAEWVLRIKVPVGYVIILMVFMYGNFVGACYNLYTTIPNLDDILHAFWGVVFMVFGFVVIKTLLGEPKDTKAFVAYLIFSFGFCLIAAVFWEIYEFTLDSANHNYDMQEDTIVNSINSFFMHDPYDHLHTWQVDGIARTELYDADGNLLATIPGGYLDVGNQDTMWDILWCVVASIGLGAILMLDWLLDKKHWVYKLLIPVTTKTVETEQDSTQNDKEAEEVAVTEAQIQSEK